MNRKWVVLYVLVGVLLAVVGVAGYGIVQEATWRPGITPDNFNRIREGDSFERVVTLLGRPPEGAMTTPGLPGFACYWDVAWAKVRVDFDADGMVSGGEIRTVEGRTKLRAAETPLDVFYHLLGR